MPRIPGLKQTRSSPSPARSRSSASKKTGDGTRHSKAPAFGRLLIHLLPICFALAPVPVLIFLNSPSNWAMDRLGWGIAPVFAWFSCAVLVLRYKGLRNKMVWRGLGGTAIAVALSLALLSMFNASDGRLQDASLGGNWGGQLGGSPWPLGWAKVLLILFAGPLLLYPKLVFRTYLMAIRSAAGHLSGMLQRISSRSTEAPETTDEDSESVESDSPTAVDPPPQKEWAAPSEEPSTTKRKGLSWQLPALDILNKGVTSPVPQTVLTQMARHIESTLADHRVDVKVEDIRTGPRVIRFGLVPGWTKRQNEGQKGYPGNSTLGAEVSRVRVQSILAREKDLALALKTPYLRMEAPVPGEALVGLEVPSPHPSRVFLRSVTESPAFQKLSAKGGLPIAVGEDTGGTPVVADLTALPHLLIAGATGSGKSVCINTVIASLLLTNRPDRLRMVMVDPKRVELTPFNGIPNLILPVIVDTDQVLVVLRGVQNEMLRRYKMLEEAGVRNLEGYNKKAKEPMPFLLVIIDELADLMMTAAFDVEQALVRLAQLGRATGIHLILATQRPSVNVVTGLLKANIPARIAFAVASQVDSRVILDAVGAERLLGKGDMLLLSQDSPKPVRVQGTFVYDQEIEELVSFWTTQSGPPMPKIVLEESEEEEADDLVDDDDLMESARSLAQRTPNISASVLQRRLQIGYSKATQLVGQLETEGMVARSAASSRPPW